MPKRKFKSPQHPIDASGVLEAAKFGHWDALKTQLLGHPELSIADFNELPPGRSFGVVHQISYHGNQAALEQLLGLHPQVDLKLPTKDGQTALEVAQGEGVDDVFLEYLRERLRVQSHHELVNKARDGEWAEFFHCLTADQLPLETINSVPSGRTWGIHHQICYWGDLSVLEKILELFPDLDLEQETVEEAAQLPRDIALGRGHTEFANALKTKLDEKKKPAESLVTAPSAAMKTPISAAGKLCCICFMEDHDADTLAVSCDNNHYMCQTCFSGWVESESEIETNPQNILLNGGRITCPCKKSDDCDSLAYANKLIAMVVTDELYEKYLRARDYVVGKEAVAGALSKIKGGDMDAVEQEQIRNMYCTKDGYSAYMCGQCNFGPIDHGWCSNLSSHHGAEKHGGGSINNACPKCGWFAKDISGWPRWDGKFQSPSLKVKFKPKPVE